MHNLARLIAESILPHIEVFGKSAGIATVNGTLNNPQYRIVWAEKVSNPKLRVRCIYRELIFHWDRAELLSCEFPMGTFPYADPEFPNNLLERLRP